MDEKKFKTYNFFHRKIFLLYFFLFIIFAAGIFSPLFLCTTSRDLCSVIYTFYGFTCHQLASRSFFIGSVQLPVCARCLPMNISILLALSYYFYKKKYSKPFKMNWLLFIVLILPTVIDGGTQALGLRESTTLLRAITGIPFGLGWGYFYVWLTHLITEAGFLCRNLVLFNKKEVGMWLGEIKKLII